MAYVADKLLNETPLQSSTTSIGNTPNVEVENNEINIGIVEHEVRQEEEPRVANDATRVTGAIVYIEGIYTVTNKKGARQANAEEKLV